MVDKAKVSEDWERFLLGDEPLLRFGQAMFRHIPASPRCALCLAPFSGPFTGILKVMMKDPWPRNPSICRFCGDWLRKKGPGGAHIELTILFADIRGSTGLAESLTAESYVDLINRFYETATESFGQHGAIIEKLVGDEAIGLFVPAFLRDNDAAAAYETAVHLLRATGHGSADGPWVPVGVGVHTGSAFVGSVGSEERFSEFTALGDSVNTTSRLSSMAGAGEVIVSSAAAEKADLDLTAMSPEALQLKGKAESLQVYRSSFN